MNYTEIEMFAINNIRKMASDNNPSNIRQLNALHPFILINNVRLYENTTEEKDLVLHHLNQKFIAVKNTEDVEINTGKNLLYFSVFRSEDYLDLLEGCLKSIVANTPNINFDVLFITDDAFKTKIEQFPILSNFKADYLVLPSVDSAQMASIRKLDIYRYKKINEYENIFFLDADSLCLKDLNTIFFKAKKTETLYISFTHIHMAERLLNPTHGLMHFSVDEAHTLSENPDLIPFNAGQFLFKNSKRMRMHFENVIWLRIAWPAKYFYEQSVMNHYFVLRRLCEPLINESNEQLVTITYNSPKFKPNFDLFSEILKDRPNTKNIMTVSGATASRYSSAAIINSTMKTVEMPDTSKLHNDSTVVIHFAATLPSGKTKKEFIKNYINANQLHV